MLVAMTCMSTKFYPICCEVSGIMGDHMLPVDLDPYTHHPRTNFSASFLADGSLRMSVKSTRLSVV